MKSILSRDVWENRFNEEQYDLLVECSKESNFKKWIIYRRKNRNIDILLEGAILESLFLEKVDLRKANLKNANLSSCNLKNSILIRADLKGAKLDGANLENAELISTNLKEARLTSANLKGAKLRFACLQDVIFHEAYLKEANFARADLTRAFLHGTFLQNANFSYANLNGVKIRDAHLQSSNFGAAIVNGETLIWSCFFNKETDFTGVGLTSARVEPQLLSLFETNIRRIWWKKWFDKNKQDMTSIVKRFKKSKIKNSPLLLNYISILIQILLIKTFWWTTDYGSSTIRLLKTFIGISIVFAILYTLLPELTNDLVLCSTNSILYRFIRAFYFSIVTMTTVGFGDISANPASLAGHIALILHVIIGYTILGGLVVRLGILFQKLPEAECRDIEFNEINQRFENDNDDDI